MVESIRGQAEIQLPTPISSPINLDGVTDFGALLAGLVGRPGAGSPSAALGPASGEAAVRPANALPRLGVAQSLHYLTVPIAPRLAARFAPPGSSVPVEVVSRRGQFPPALAGASLPAGPGGTPAAATAPAFAIPTATAPLCVATPGAPSGPLALSDYPRPQSDNGRGVHWVPTTRQSPQVVDSLIERAQALHVRWVTFLNEPGDLTGNEYLVKKLTASGIMPVMRIYSDGGAPITDDLAPLVRHYRDLGVSYFQLYNEPNLSCENGGKAPDVQRYLDAWLPAAQQVIAAGGLPGLGALSPQGESDDLAFLRDAVEGLKARGAGDVLGRTWLSVHNYGSDYLRVRQYDQVVKNALGRSLPLIGTEAGIYPGGGVTEDDQVRIIKQAYDYLAQREPSYFAYSLWVLANGAGGGHDSRWESQALYHTDGPSALARVLENTL